MCVFIYRNANKKADFHLVHCISHIKNGFILRICKVKNLIPNACWLLSKPQNGVGNFACLHIVASLYYCNVDRRYPLPHKPRDPGQQVHIACLCEVLKCVIYTRSYTRNIEIVSTGSMSRNGGTLCPLGNNCHLIYEHRQRRLHVHTDIVGLRICATDVCILNKHQEQNIQIYVSHPPSWVYPFETYYGLLLC